MRDPRGATAPASYYVPGTRMVAEWDATLAVQRGYESSVAVYRCVNAIANALTASPFRAGADPDNPKSFNPNAPLAKLLGPMTGRPGLAGRPTGTANGQTAARALWRWSVAQWLVTGRFAWEIETNRSDAPVAVWPLMSRLLTAVPSGRGSAQYFQQFIYGMPNDEVRYRPAEVVYAWRPAQSDWRQAESPLQAARLPISVVVTQGQYDYAFLSNGGVPAHILVHPAIDDDDKREAWRRQFLAEHGGPTNAGRTAFAEYDRNGDGAASDLLDIKTIGQSAKDQQAVDRYRQYSDEVYVALGTPRSIAGDASGRTFDNASQEYLNWHEETVQTLAREFAEAINTQLAPLLGGEVGWWDFSALQTQRKRFNPYEGIALARAGVISNVELRRELDLPEEPESPEESAGTALADRVTAYVALVGNGYSPELAAQLAGLDAPPDAPVMAEREEVPPAVVASEDQSSASLPVAGGTTERSRRDRRGELWNASDRRIRAHEVIFARAMSRLFARQEQAVLRSLGSKRGRQALRTEPGDAIDPSGLFDAAYWTAETQAAAEELYRAIFATAGTRVADVFGLDLDLADPYVEEFVTSRANQLAGPVVQTTYEDIQATLVEGAAAGEDVPELSARVRGVFEQAGKTRSERIARTEVVGAFNGSAYQVGQQLPGDVAAGQEWIATRDSRTRDDHRMADGQIVDMRTPFTVGGHRLRYPGDPDAAASEVVNCRCTIGFLTPEEMAERSRQVPYTRAREVISLVAQRQMRADQVEELSA